MKGFFILKVSQGCARGAGMPGAAMAVARGACAGKGKRAASPPALRSRSGSLIKRGRVGVTQLMAAAA